MAANRRRNLEQPLKRRVAVRQPRKTILIFSEGERTEPEYLDALKRQPRVRDIAPVDLRVETGHGGSVPMTLVSWRLMHAGRLSMKRLRSTNSGAYSTSSGPGTIPACKTPSNRRARVASNSRSPSNPCFELWLVLHFQDHSAWLDNDPARRLRRSLDGSGDKGIDAATYMPLVRDAARRAEELDERHRRNGTAFPHDNPSSGMHRLLTTIEHRRAP